MANFFPAILGVLRECLVFCSSTHKHLQHFPPLLIQLALIIFVFLGKLCMAPLSLWLPAMPPLSLVPTERDVGIGCLLCPRNLLRYPLKRMAQQSTLPLSQCWCPRCECFALSEILPLDRRFTFLFSVFLKCYLCALFYLFGI